MKYIRKFNESVVKGIPRKKVTGKNAPINILKEFFNIRQLMETLADEMGYESKELKYLGGGVYGLAFEVVGDNKVFKLTFDESEAYIANKIRKKNTKNIINYYDVRHIKFNKEITIEYTKHHLDDVFVLIMDKVKTFNEDDKNLFNNLTYRIDFDSFDPKVIRRALEYRMESVRKKNKLGDDKEFNKDAKKMIDGIINSLNECKKLGIEVNDIHLNNVGWDNDGNLILFDLTTVGKYNYHSTKDKLKSIEIDYDKGN